MKTCRALFLLPAVLLLGSCSSTSMRAVVDPPVSWEFLQSVGGISVGQPRLADGNLWLPLTMDLSGNRSITKAPTVSNTGRKCIRATLRQTNLLTTPVGYYDLALQVHSGTLEQRGEGGCDEVPLFTGELKPPFSPTRNMKFRIWYRDYLLSEHFIGEVALP
ncbi:MAG: hypothetical protein ACO3PV_05650 [Pseudohongiellaceae bacterium]